MAYVEIKKVLETARNGYHSDFGSSMADLTSLREVLEDTPTADVVEVKHGEWIKDSLVDGASICSLCGYTDYRFNYDTNDWGSNFCPNCGADMRGDKE